MSGYLNREADTKKRLIDGWYDTGDVMRRDADGFVFFVHTKFLLIDPLSDDPLVCSGSANFSSGSLLQNDENMLLIRGNTRVADIYLTEFDRIFRHFYFRDIANELAAAKTSDDAKAIFLDETDAWSDSYFKAGTLKNNRRLMFFEKPTTTWFANAAAGGEETESGPAKKKPAAKKKGGKEKTPGRKTASKKSKKTTPKKASKKTSKKKTAKAAKKKALRR
jgi:phosphatidylserine/phosphatidylglycerophosphate/cardiolipin synthase-like enzyme